jgi:uncharacterized protein (TIGR02001 family)
MELFMKLRSMLLLVAMMCLSATPALALDVEGSASLGVYDKYLLRGIDLSDSTAVTQGAAEISANGFKLGVWANAQLATDGAYDGGRVNEVDLTLEYGFDLGEIFSLSVGNVSYALEDLDDTNEAYVGATVNTLLSPTLTAYWDWDEAEENGLFYSAAVSHTFEPCSHAGVNLGALISYNDKSDYSVGNYSDWHNYELNASVDFKPIENLTITPSLLYSAPISDEAKRAIDSEWLAGINLSYSFNF